MCLLATIALRSILFENCRLVMDSTALFPTTPLVHPPQIQSIDQEDYSKGVVLDLFMFYYSIFKEQVGMSHLQSFSHIVVGDGSICTQI